MDLGAIHGKVVRKSFKHPFEQLAMSLNARHVDADALLSSTAGVWMERSICKMMK